MTHPFPTEEQTSTQHLFVNFCQSTGQNSISWGFPAERAAYDHKTMADQKHFVNLEDLLSEKISQLKKWKTTDFLGIILAHKSNEKFEAFRSVLVPIILKNTRIFETLNWGFLAKQLKILFNTTFSRANIFH